MFHETMNRRNYSGLPVLLWSFVYCLKPSLCNVHTISKTCVKHCLCSGCFCSYGWWLVCFKSINKYTIVCIIIHDYYQVYTYMCVIIYCFCRCVFLQSVTSWRLHLFPSGSGPGWCHACLLTPVSSYWLKRAVALLRAMKVLHYVLKVF